MRGIPADFLEVVQPAAVPCSTNSVYETNGLDGTKFITSQNYELNDKFFLLSAAEIYGNSAGSNNFDGSQLEYYKGLQNTELIKYDVIGIARTCWLRSSYSLNAYGVHRITTNGSLSFSNANNSYGVVPACIIA